MKGRNEVGWAGPVQKKSNGGPERGLSERGKFAEERRCKKRWRTHMHETQSLSLTLTHLHSHTQQITQAKPKK